MQLVKKLFNFYIIGSLHVGLAVFALVNITLLSLHLMINNTIPFFIFFGTVFGYNALKYSHLLNITFFKTFKYLGIAMISLFSLFMMIFHFFKMSNNIQILILQIGIMVLIYPLFRKKFLLKMMVVSFCITYITCYIPLYGSKLMNDTCVWLIIERFLIVFCLLIPLEIVDIKKDALNLITLPQVIGIKRTKYLGYLLLLIYILLCFLSNTFFIVDLIISVTTAFFIYFSHPKRFKYFTLFWLESIPIFWFGLLYFFKLF